MAFNIFEATYNDQKLVKKYINEITQIAGVEVKYMPVKYSNASYDGLAASEAYFKGEDPDTSYASPLIIKAIMHLPPEAAKQWEAMGFYSVDMTNLFFPKETIIGTLGRRPMPRDRIYLTYNDTGFEVTDCIEQSPNTFFEIFTYEVKLKKLVESFEDSDLYSTQYAGSYLHPSAGSGTGSAYVASGVDASALSGTGPDPTTAVPSASQEDRISGLIEDLPGSAGSGVGITTGYGSSDDDLFGNW